MPPILIVVMLVLVTARTIGEIEHHQMPAAAEEIRVIGHRFWWEVRYPKHDVVTANEIHVPLSDRKNRVPTEMMLESADVIHGFWVPQLNGKTMLVPNYSNTMWIEPYTTGIYLGNCTVLCGQQHANMLIRVVVDTPDVYQKWLDSQKQAPVPIRKRRRVNGSLSPTRAGLVTTLTAARSQRRICSRLNPFR